MTSPLDKLPLEFTDDEIKELENSTLEAAAEEIIDRVTDFFETLEEIGFDPLVLMSAALQVYCTLAASHGDRELYDEQLEIAASDEWESATVH